MTGASALDWVGAALSFAAILVAVGVARQVWVQAQRLYRESADRGDATYARDRYEALTDLCTEVLDGSHSLATVTDDRWSELLNADLTAASREGTSGREAALAVMARLETRLELLALTGHLLPWSATGRPRVAEALRRLQTESAWLMGDLTLCVVSHFGDPQHDPIETWRREELVQESVEGSIHNVSRFLLIALRGKRPDETPSWADPDSPWPRIRNQRVEALLDGLTTEQRDTKVTSDLRSAAHAQLVTSIERFRDAFVGVVDAYERDRTSRQTRAT